MIAPDHSVQLREGIGVALALLLVKIVLMGEEGVGKTTLLERYLGRGFRSTCWYSTGADYAINEQEIAGKMIKFQLWNLSTKPRFDAVRSVYYLGSLGGLFLYDVTRPETFQNLPKWVQEFWRNNGKGIVPVVILGNKVDLRHKCLESVTPEEGQRYCEELSEETILHGFETKHLEIVAKTGQNISEAFDILGKAYLKMVVAEAERFVAQGRFREAKDLLEKIDPAQ